MADESSWLDTLVQGYVAVETANVQAGVSNTTPQQQQALNSVPVSSQPQASQPATVGGIDPKLLMVGGGGLLLLMLLLVVRR